MAPRAAASRKDAGKVMPVVPVIQRERMRVCVCVSDYFILQEKQTGDISLLLRSSVFSRQMN